MFLKICEQDLYMIHNIDNGKIQDKFDELLITAKLVGYESTFHKAIDMIKNEMDLRIYMGNLCKFVIKFKLAEITLVHDKDFKMVVRDIREVDFLYFVPNSGDEPYSISLDISDIDSLIEEVDKVIHYL